MNTGIFPFIFLYFNFFQAHFMVFSIHVFSFFKLTLGCIVKNLPAKGGDRKDMGWIHGFMKWPPAPVFLPGKFRGQEPGRLKFMGP